MVKQIILAEGQSPQFEGDWTIGEILQAVDWLKQFILGQRLQQPPPPQKEK